ncbi:MAG: adenylate kinase [Promethearchaeota archaeon]
MKRIILFGPPGAGKGTMSSQIKEIVPEIIHISTGDIFRENLKNNTPLGQKAKAYMDKGELVPDDVVIDMVKDRLNQDDVKKNGFILDGFPRTMNQAMALESITDIDLVILLRIPNDVIIKRILGRYSCDNCGAIYNKFFMPPKKEGICDKCGAKIKFEQRTDDNEETLKNRLAVYEKNASPIIEFYRSKGILKEVNYEKKLSEEQLKDLLDL